MMIDRDCHISLVKHNRNTEYLSSVNHAWDSVEAEGTT